MVVRVNFNRLMTIFNVIIVHVCPVSTCNLVVEAMTTSGAAKTQQGFIVKLGRKRGTRTKDLADPSNADFWIKAISDLDPRDSFSYYTMMDNSKPARKKSGESCVLDMGF
ncbi:uncharacterized protein [Montipora foliosa]|uniref:uncharacterized protein n=1 Tax=Montipora foliosa TaxID=591990 RepID=UPI0035F1D214